MPFLFWLPMIVWSGMLAGPLGEKRQPEPRRDSLADSSPRHASGR
jgi:hypothetical protein